MKRLAVLIASLILFACGGGGGGSSTPDSPLGPSRPGVYYGYYATCPTCLSATQDHINLIWETRFDGDLMFSDMAQAKLPTVLDVDGLAWTEAELSAYFTALQAANVLQYVVALYPVDEPDVNHVGEVQMQGIAVTLRKVASEFYELRDVKLAVIYGAGSNRPGISAFDWVGFDNYDAGTGVLGDQYYAFKALLRPDQRIILIPGGAPLGELNLISSINDYKMILKQ